MKDDNTFLHPGFPAIGAIEKFRENTAKALGKREAEFKRELDKFPPKTYHVAHTEKNALRMRKEHDSPLGMNAYFDKSVYKSLMEDIKDEIAEIGEHLMEEALFDGMADTARQLRAMTNFKSKINPTKPASDDMYEVIGESLNFSKTRFSSANQFLSYEAGSFDIGESSPQEGVKGSRMEDYDETLITITEEGTSPFDAHLVKNVFKFPAKRNM
jgi:hypothetical protein